MTAARTISDDIKLLGDLLGEALQSQAGMDAFALEEEVRALAKANRNGDLTCWRPIGGLDRRPQYR